MKTLIAKWMVLVACVGLASTAFAGEDAAAVVQKMLESDPWGLSGALVNAHVTLTDKQGGTSNLVFRATSRRHDAPFAQSVVRFSAPSELSGAGFLQVQNRSGDDDRFLFLPELKRVRRISGQLRNNAFMGTDFSFADLDRRDLREGTAKLEPDATLGKHDCYVLQITPKDETSSYSRIQIWVRKDNYLALKMEMYDRTSTLLKTFIAQEVKRVSGSWFVTKSRMTNHQTKHVTDLVLDDVKAGVEFSPDDFTVRALEKS